MPLKIPRFARNDNGGARCFRSFATNGTRQAGQFGGLRTAEIVHDLITARAPRRRLGRGPQSRACGCCGLGLHRNIAQVQDVFREPQRLTDRPRLEWAAARRKRRVTIGQLRHVTGRTRIEVSQKRREES